MSAASLAGKQVTILTGRFTKTVTLGFDYPVDLSGPSTLAAPKTPPPLIVDGTPFLDANQAATVLLARHGLTLRFLRAEEVAIAGRVEMGWRELLTLSHRVELANLVNEEISLLDEVSNTTTTTA